MIRDIDPYFPHGLDGKWLNEPAGGGPGASYTGGRSEQGAGQTFGKLAAGGVGYTEKEDVHGRAHTIVSRRKSGRAIGKEAGVPQVIS